MKNFPSTKINDYVWEIPPGVKPCQKVPVRIYADSALLEKMKADLTIEQGINVGCLPGVYKYSIILPDGPPAQPQTALSYALLTQVLPVLIDEPQPH